MIPEGHLCPVQNGAVVVGIKTLANLNVAAVVAPKGRGDAKPLAGFAEQLANDLFLFIDKRGPQLVVCKAQVLAAYAFFQ